MKDYFISFFKLLILLVSLGIFILAIYFLTTYMTLWFGNILGIVIMLLLSASVGALVENWYKKKSIRIIKILGKEKV